MPMVVALFGVTQQLLGQLALFVQLCAQAQESLPQLEMAATEPVGQESALLSQFTPSALQSLPDGQYLSSWPTLAQHVCRFHMQ